MVTEDVLQEPIDTNSPRVTVAFRGIGTGISRQARGFLFVPVLSREASKRVAVFDGETGPKPIRLRS